MKSRIHDVLRPQRRENASDRRFADFATSRISIGRYLLHDRKPSLQAFDFDDLEKIASWHSKVMAQVVRHFQAGFLHLRVEDAGDKGHTATTSGPDLGLG